jgi:PKD repeat protein
MIYKRARLPPVAAFSYDVDFLDVIFADESSGMGATVSSWFWNFGDGQTSTEQNPTHTYAAAGSYTVTLVVRDHNNRPSEATTQEVTAIAAPGNLIIILGDSNGVGQGDTANLDNGLQLTTAYPQVQLNTRRAITVADPPTWFDQATRDLQPYSAAGSAGMGVELTLGRELYRHGYEVFIGKIAMSGADTPDWNGFLQDHLHDYIDARVLESGHQLGAVVISLGTNDASNSTNANAFAANMTTLVASIRAQHGANVRVALIETPSAVGSAEPFVSTVRAQALAYVASDPLAVLVPTDDIPMKVGDSRHFEANGYASIGQRAAMKLLDAFGFDRLTVTGLAPEFIGADCGLKGIGSLVPRSWAGAVDGDLELLVVSTGNGDIAPALSSAQGFTAVSSASFDSVFAGNHQRVAVWQRTVTQAVLDANSGVMPTPTVQDTNQSLAAKIFVFRGPNDTVTLGPVGGAVNNAFNTALSLTGVTTEADNSLVAMLVTGFSSVANAVAVTNAGLTSVAEQQDSSLSTGIDQRLISLTTGVKSTAGATGTATVAASASAVMAGVAIALEP